MTSLPLPISILIDITPSGVIEVTSPQTESGRWWIDLRWGGLTNKDYFESIGWVPVVGWEIYDPDSPGYGSEAPLRTSFCIGKLIKELNQLTDYRQSQKQQTS